MKKILLYICSILVCANVMQAETITGIVRESSSNDAIPYATVSLLKQDSTLYVGAISDDNGNFQIQVPTGAYIVQVSYVGYQTVHRNVSLTNERLELGNIFLKEETTTIAEVEVKADKPSSNAKWTRL